MRHKDHHEKPGHRVHDKQEQHVVCCTLSSTSSTSKFRSWPLASKGCVSWLTLFFFGTGISLTIAAIGKLMNPMNTVINHCSLFNGTVLANFPRNCTIMTWNTMVKPRMNRKILLLKVCLKTLNFSISRAFTSLKTCNECIESHSKHKMRKTNMVS